MDHTRIFVYALEGEPESLDPAAKRYSERAIRVKWLLFDSLINIGSDGRRPEPGVAEAWTVSDRGRRVDLTIRNGVRFHDGTPLDAEAVRLCFERQFATDLHDPKKQVLSALMDDIQVCDSRTRRPPVEVTTPSATWLGGTSTNSASSARTRLAGWATTSRATRSAPARS